MELFDAVTELLGAESTLGLAACLPGDAPVTSDTPYDSADLAVAHALAAAAARQVREDALAVTGCLDEECARAYVTELAERAFQRPLTSEAAENLERVFDEVLAMGEGMESALEHGVQAVFVSPLFLYRFEEEPTR